MTTFQEACTAIGMIGVDPQYSKLLKTQEQLWDNSQNSWVLVPFPTVLGKSLVQLSGGREGERRAREVVLAFFGPDFSRRGNRNKVLTSSSDEIYINSFAVSNEEWDKKLSILNQMTQTRLLSKPIERSIAQPLENLLRDFYLELNAGNETGASTIATQIELSGSLRGDNLLFLRIHQLATFGRWNDIASLNSFEDLTKIRRSRQTSNHLLRTLWYRDFDGHSQSEDPNEIRDRFIALRTHDRYRDLLGSLTKSHHYEVRALLAVFFGLLDDQLRFADLCVDLEQDEVDRLCLFSGIRNSADVGPSELPVTPMSTGDLTLGKHPVLELMELSDYEGVLGYLEAHPEDLTSVGNGILAAIELSDALSARRVIDVIDLGLCKLPESRLLGKQIGDLRSKAHGLCTSWLDWAKQSADLYRSDVFEIVSINAETWDTDWCDNFESAKQFSSDMEKAFIGPNKAQVCQAIAFILELVGENATRAGIGEIRNSALNMLVSLEMSNAQIRNAFVSLIASYEDGNVSVGEYEDLLDSASLIWGTYGSVSNFSWMLDVVEQVLKLARLSEGKLQSLIHQIHGSLQSFGESLDPSLHNLFCKIVSEFVQINPREIGVTADGEDVWGKYSGKKVGIYSLLESLPDLKIYLESVCTAADFVINQEKVASNELRHFASHSDFVVIQTSKSKHAATEELNRYITGERIYVAGRGRGSIINALLNWFPK